MESSDVSMGEPSSGIAVQEAAVKMLPSRHESDTQLWHATPCPAATGTIESNGYGYGPPRFLVQQPISPPSVLSENEHETLPISIHVEPS
jgi:hypothetical protein